MSAHVDRKTLELSAERIDAPVLSVLEWKVVDLAIREAAGSGGTLYAPTGFRRFFQRLGSALFGWTYAQPLADERLEMLRRFAGAFRRDVKRAEAMAAKLLTLGFTGAQLRAIKLVALGKGGKPRAGY